MSRPTTLLFILGCALSVGLHAEESTDDLVRRLGDLSYAVRKEATQALIDRNLKIEELQKRLEQQQEPEIRIRIATAISMNSGCWAKHDPLQPIRLTSAGHENNKPIYLARTAVKGTTHIGKFLTEWHGANFPIGREEVMIDDFELWTGTGTWKPWKPGATRLIVMGRTKEGKAVYAVRASLNNGVHPGTFIEGETEALIPWGGTVHRIKEFEVLTSEVK